MKPIFQFILASVSLLVVAGIILTSPKPEPRQQYTEAGKAYAANIEKVPVKLLVRDIQEARGKDQPMLIYVYASWCSNCRHMMQYLIPALKSPESATIRTYMMSVDTDPIALASYLTDKNYANSFTPLMVKSSNVNRLDEIMQKAGFNYTNKIPYIAYIDSNGNLTKEEIGFNSQESLLRDIRALSR